MLFTIRWNTLKWVTLPFLFKGKHHSGCIVVFWGSSPLLGRTCCDTRIFHQIRGQRVNIYFQEMTMSTNYCVQKSVKDYDNSCFIDARIRHIVCDSKYSLTFISCYTFSLIVPTPVTQRSPTVLFVWKLIPHAKGGKERIFRKVSLTFRSSVFLTVELKTRDLRKEGNRTDKLSQCVHRLRHHHT